MKPASRREAVETYVRAWNEPELGECAHLVELSCAHGITYTDPSVHLEGRGALVAHCHRLIKNRRGATVVLTGAWDEHHDVARFEWAVLSPAGSRLRSGVDFAVFAADGRLARVVGFFDPA